MPQTGPSSISLTSFPATRFAPRALLVALAALSAAATLPGQTLLKDINTQPAPGGNPSSNPAFWTSPTGLTLGAVTESGTGQELWRTDGTATGTVLVKDINPGQASSGPSLFTELPNGEVLFRGANVMAGYFKSPDATAESIDADGWRHTGDVGEIDDDGFLRITDRKKDLIITAGGKNITPSLIENELKFSAYISDAVVIGDGRKYLTCLIMIDRDNVEHYAQSHAIPFTDYRSLCACEEVVQLVDSIIREVNGHFSSVETIKKFRLIDVLLTAEDEELTPTMKLKRSFVSEKYSDLIESMYA